MKVFMETGKANCQLYTDGLTIIAETRTVKWTFIPQTVPLTEEEKNDKLPLIINLKTERNINNLRSAKVSLKMKDILELTKFRLSF